MGEESDSGDGFPAQGSGAEGEEGSEPRVDQDAGVDPDAPTVIKGGKPFAGAGEKPGDVIGRYRLVDEIGRGGFGVVWRAEQLEDIHREVALKVIKAGMDSEEIVARFESERQTLAMMEHPNIAEILDAGATEEGRPYFVMELVRGKPLTEYCDGKEMRIAGRLELFIPVCHAIQHAHQKAVLHRDLKPSNILVAEVDGKPVPKVIDFGIAKALSPEEDLKQMQTREGMVVGTPQYMSPEQAGSEEDLDTRSDIYALGVILCELLTGDTPLSSEEFRRAADAEVLRMVREEEVKRPSSKVLPSGEATSARAKARHSDPSRLHNLLKGDLDWITLKALEKERERRYVSASALAADLRHYLKREPVEAGPPSAAYKIRKFVMRNRAAIVVAGLIVFLLVGGVVASTWQALRATKAEREIREREGRIADFLVESGQTGEAAGGDPRRAMFAYFHALERCVPGSDRWQRAAVLLAGAAEAVGTVLVHDTPPIGATPGDENNRSVMTFAEGPDFARWDLETRERLPVIRKKPDAKGEGEEKGEAKEGGDKIPREVGGEQVLGAHREADRCVTVPRGYEVVYLRELSTGKILAELKHDEIVVASINDEKLGIRHLRGPAFLVDPQIEEHGIRGKVARKPSRIGKAVFDPDGRRVITWTASLPRLPARIWDAENGSLIGRTDSAGCRMVALHPDGEFLVTSDDDQILRFWSLEDGGLLGESGALPELAEYVRFSPDGSKFLTSGGIGSARLWDSETFKPVGNPLPGNAFHNIALFSEDSKFVYIGTGRNTVEVWDVERVVPAGESVAHGGEITSLFRNRKFPGKIITASRDLTVRVLPDPAPLGEVTNFGDEVPSISFSRDGKILATGAEDGALLIWRVDLEGRKLEQLHKIKLDPHFGMFRCAISPDGKMAAYGNFVGEGALLDLRKRGRTLREFQHRQMYMDMEFTPDGKALATCSFDGTAKVWPLGRGNEEEPVVVEHGYQVCAIAMDADGEVLVTAGGSGGPGKNESVRLWQLKTGETIKLARPIYLDTIVWSVALSPDGKRLLAGCEDHVARFFDAETGTELAKLRHEGTVHAAAFNAEGNLMLTGSEDGTVRIWETETGRPKGRPYRFSAPVTEAVFVPGKASIAVGCQDGQFHFVDLDEPVLPSENPDELLLWIETVTGLEEDGNGVIHPLSQSAWEERVGRWNALGK